MHIVIAGYGRVGRSIASGFETAGHTVAIIDRDVAAFEDPDPVRGRKVTGEAFDRETLESAGIGRAGCFCATTSGDNSNFVSARIAKEHYGVGIVVARIYEPRRAVIYRDIGIDTISSVDWATAEFLARVPASESAPTQAAAVSAPPIPTARTGQSEAAHILIVGGGKAGAYLAERLRKDHPVTLVELRSDKIERLRRRMPDVDVLHGDGCEPGVLERAGALDADFVAAATGDDEDNLVVSHLMKSIHGTATVVARINHPANEWLFTPAWGVDVPVGAAAGLYQAVSARCDLPLTAKE